jgi:Flp pilus assembly pilin Flp
MAIVRRLVRGRAGQTTSEYALIAGGVALACVVAVLAIGGGIGDLFGSNAKRFPSGSFLPPAVGTPSNPDSHDDCVDDGWRAFPQFTAEWECHQYVDSLAP